MASPGADLAREDVERAIAKVIDPCSRFNGSNIPLTDLGMIRNIEVTDATVHYELLLDDPACPYVSQIVHELRHATSQLPGDREAEFSMAVDEVWTTDRLSARAQERMEKMRELVKARVASRRADSKAAPSRDVA